MKLYVGIPFHRMHRINPAHMALGTGWSTSPYTIKVGSMTAGIGTISRAVQFDVIPVQGVGEIPPEDGMD